MPDQTPREFAAAEVNQTRKDIAQARDMTADQLFAACTARANLAIAAALLDVADAIRESDPSMVVSQSMDRLTAAVRGDGGETL
ncbi:hypothetical protein [Streptomyces sp. NBC_00687]|uniref:hypothetical protein n=1 Tax=Streptomyces sp. NBC_00687 TaxID=2975807 RepID=UPI00225704C7|nr:hypothetical protein [Streptomyces sp. NBC_00687]MCX4912841.1 hypothetical protein [Streptomyces sp. NBC_00687]